MTPVIVRYPLDDARPCKTPVSVVFLHCLSSVGFRLRLHRFGGCGLCLRGRAGKEDYQRGDKQQRENAYPERTACAEYVERVGVETLAGGNVVGEDGGGIVGEVHQHRYPQRAGANEHIAEHRPHQHAWHEPIELEMHKRENRCRNPYRYVRAAVRAALGRRLAGVRCDKVLQHAAESEFFAYGGQQCHQPEVEQQAPYAVYLQKLLCQAVGGFLLLLHPRLYGLPCGGQGELLVQVA